MLDKNNIIVIRGRAASFKSSLAVAIANTFIDKKVVYIDLEGHNNIKFNENINIINNPENLDIKSIINDNDVVVIDYIELLNYKKDDLLKLKEYVSDTNKTLILVSCRSTEIKNVKKSVDYFYTLEDIADLTIIPDKK